MKFVRWLGAFGSGSDLNEAADWEQSQIERQVAAEPLWRGRSFWATQKSVWWSIIKPADSTQAG